MNILIRWRCVQVAKRQKKSLIFTVRPSNSRRSVRRESRDIATEQNAYNTGASMHYACARSGFSRAMGVSPNQRPHPCRSRLARPSKCGFQVVIMIHVYAKSLLPALFPPFSLNKHSNVDRDRKVCSKHDAPTWRENKLFTRHVVRKNDIFYARREGETTVFA